MKWNFISLFTLFIVALALHNFSYFSRNELLEDPLDPSAQSTSSGTGNADVISSDEAGDDWRRKAKAAGEFFFEPFDVFDIF